MSGAIRAQDLKLTKGTTISVFALFEPGAVGKPNEQQVEDFKHSLLEIHAVVSIFKKNKLQNSILK